MDLRLVLMVIFTLTAWDFCAVKGASYVAISVLETAIHRGAVCLDGTAPSYAYSPGFGDGAHNWHVHLQKLHTCRAVVGATQVMNASKGQSLTWEALLALSKKNHGQLLFDGLLENNATFNPEFYNWNVVNVFYCDGSSFMSDVEDLDPVYNITYRGMRIFDAVMEELLLRKGMIYAKNALLSGSSAGGLATILHCDKFGTFFSNNKNSTRVKCLSDSGFFIQGQDFIGADWRENYSAAVISTHGLANLLPTSCLMKYSPILCFFPEYLVQDIQTPLFLIESAFDAYQLSENVFSPDAITPRWKNCTHTNLQLCNWAEIKIMKDFRTTFINTLRNTVAESTPANRIGYFVHSCYNHVHIETKRYSTCSFLTGRNVLANRSVAQAFGDWYFDRRSYQEIDTRNDLPRNCSTTAYPAPLFNQKCAMHA